MSTRWPLVALVAVAVFSSTALLPTPDGLRVSPLDTYGDAVVDGRVPYRDFSLEYPPGALPVIVLPALVRGAAYETSFRGLALILGALLIACTAYLLRDATRSEIIVGLGLVALLPALLGPIVFFRFDLWPALLVTASLVALDRRRTGLASVCLGVGAAAKIYAAAVLPALMSVAGRAGARRGVRRAGTLFVAAGLLVTLPLAVVAPGGVASSFQRQLDRPLQIESTGGSVLLLIGHPRVEFASGSWSLVGTSADAVGAVTAAAGLVVLVVLWITLWRRRSALDTPALAYAGCVAIVLVSARVVSPQYLVWLVPLAAVVRGRSGVVTCVLLAVSCVLTQLLYPARYEELVADDSLPVVLLAARNALLLACAGVLVGALMSRLRRSAPTAASQRVSG